jgi:hypothetical protein
MSNVFGLLNIRKSLPIVHAAKCNSIKFSEIIHKLHIEYLIMSIFSSTNSMAVVGGLVSTQFYIGRLQAHEKWLFIIISV